MRFAIHPTIQAVNQALISFSFAIHPTIQVVDEGDRLLQQSYQDWLSKVLDNAYRAPLDTPANHMCVL
jgi:hypothetical protein